MMVPQWIIKFTKIGAKKKIETLTIINIRLLQTKKKLKRIRNDAAIRAAAKGDPMAVLLDEFNELQQKMNEIRDKIQYFMGLR